MKILDAYDLTGSLRDAGELAGCSHHTVKHYVDRRAAGWELDQVAARPQLIDEYLPKVEEWVERSKGKVRADKAHEKLVAMGYKGSERTWSVVAAAPLGRSHGHHRADLVTVSGQVSCPPLGSSHWPLTLLRRCPVRWGIATASENRPRHSPAEAGLDPARSRVVGWCRPRCIRPGWHPVECRNRG